MTSSNPLVGSPDEENVDTELVRRVQEGEVEALDALIRRHQRWIYNIALRMLFNAEDAEDATQEILIKLLTKVSTFEGRSTFRTWLYKVVSNHVLTMKRGRMERPELTFEAYGRGLAAAPDLDLPDPNSVPADLNLLVDEARIGCTSGMLLCLNREQRVVYILGEMFGVSDAVGAELLEISRDNFRQRLARARRELYAFMNGQCGLVNTSNPCRCAKKTRAFIAAGYVDPARLVFAKSRLDHVRDVAPHVHDGLDALDAQYAEIYRAHPFQASPDFVTAVRALMNQSSSHNGRNEP